MCPWLCGVLCAVAGPPSPLVAQAAGPAPSAAFTKARAVYDTPVDSGLQSFHCEVNFDWKDFLQKANNQPVPDADARLTYLRSIRLSVDDDLRGSGELHWTAPSPAPEDSEDSITKMRGGLQGIWSAFFQTWNGYATGNMVSYDPRSVVERTADGGFHVTAHQGPGLAEEMYDDKLVLKSVHVSTPSLESSLTPEFSPGPHGLLVTTIHSVDRQPPTAPPTEVAMKVTYAPVGSFQIPSTLQVAVGPANFAFRLVNCTVKTQ